MKHPQDQMHRQFEPKSSMFACARVFVEVDLEKGILGDIILTPDDWACL